MKNQSSQSHWWWLENHRTVKRSPWLQSTLTELNEKTKAMLKLIEEDADSFAKRAEMYYKKRPELVSMVEDFYRTHRLLAERYDQVRPETGIRLLKTGETPFAKNHQSEKLMMSSEDNGYDSYSENCDVVESVDSEVDDPEQENEENAKFVDYKEQEEVRSAAANDGVLKLRREFEILGEENKAQKDQIKQKDDTGDEVMKLREEIERLRKENKAQKDELKQKDSICDEVTTLRKEIERVRGENKSQKDKLKQKDTICDEVMMLRKEIERVREENKSQKDKLKQKDTICDEVMMLREEIEKVREENKLQKDKLKQKDTICDEVMMLRKEIQRVREEHRTQKDDLKQKDREKIEVIRQLSSTIDVLKQENVKMRSFIAKMSSKKWKTPFEFNKLIGTLSGKLFKGIPRNQPSVVAL